MQVRFLPGAQKQKKAPKGANFVSVPPEQARGACVQESKTLRAYVASARSNISARCTDPVRVDSVIAVLPPRRCYHISMDHKPLASLLDLSGKRAIVTGGAMGIGYGIAARLSEAGAKVLIADKDGTAAEKAASELNAIAIAVDVSDEAQVQAMVDKAATEFGGLDILVNNAGIYPRKPAMEETREEFERIIHTNLMGAYFCAKAAAKRMIEQGAGGSIINITSIDALHPSSVGLAFYDASKHGLWGFTKSLALELAPHNIRVNAIAPGGVATPGAGFGKAQDPALAAMMEAFLAKIPMHRMADADEIGKVALFLASDMASYMTGSQVIVDGGTLLA